MTATATLARNRLRPVPWGWLAALAAGWFPCTSLLATAPRDPGAGVVAFHWAAFLLGLGGAVLTAPEIDPARDVLRGAPVSWWQTLALRLAGWLALGAAPILALAVRLDGDAGWTTADLIRGAQPNFLLVTAVCFLAARLTSVLGGGAAAIAVVIALDLAGRAWPGWFPIQVASVPGSPLWQAGRVWIVAGSLALVAVTLLAEHRTGTRPCVPRRSPSARPSQAHEARVRP